MDTQGEVANLTCTKPGMLSIVVDAGRPHSRHLGIPEGGAMDRMAAACANFHVGNSPNTPCIEMTLLGPEFILKGDNVLVAFTGNAMQPEINGETVNLNCTLRVSGQNMVRFKPNAQGCRSYMAIGGEWQLPEWLGSSSIYQQEWQRFTPWARLEKGWSLDIHTTGTTEQIALKTATSRGEIRILPGPDQKNVGHLIQAGKSFRVDKDSNRMALRLSPDVTPASQSPGMISSGVIPGTIQMTSSGQLIVLLRDCQTTGGYPRVAQVIEADVDTLGQLRPGDALRFRLIDTSEAIDALHSYRRRLSTFEGH